MIPCLIGQWCKDEEEYFAKEVIGKILIEGGEVYETLRQLSEKLNKEIHEVLTYYFYVIERSKLEDDFAEINEEIKMQLKGFNEEKDLENYIRFFIKNWPS